jgi:hypothetical protein
VPRATASFRRFLVPFFGGGILKTILAAYDPHSPTFRQLSNFFWEQYSSETGSWRDQPTWAYTLHHFNVTPLVLTTEGDIEKGGDLFKHGGGMGWGGHVYKKNG